MSSWSPFFALAIFPLAYFVAINPVGFSWSFHHGLKAMPPELLEKVQYIGPSRSVAGKMRGEARLIQPEGQPAAIQKS